MNRLSMAFQRTKPFIGYLTAGDGGLDYSTECAIALIEGGVDILEIGLPFSDPVADGSVIQMAHERSLSFGTDSFTILEMARRIREVSEVPLVLFSYFNPILQKRSRYLELVKSSGFDAVLIVDAAVPINSCGAEPIFEMLSEADLLPIVLASPSTDRERLEQIGSVAEGFLYYAAQRGTTGIRSRLPDDFGAQIARLRPYFHIPIVAGFGIADRASAYHALEYADGFVVGSAFVKKIEEKISSQGLAQFARSIDPREGGMSAGLQKGRRL